MTVELSESFILDRSRTFDLESVFTLRLVECSQYINSEDMRRDAIAAPSRMCVDHLSFLSSLSLSLCLDLRALHSCLNQCADLCDLDISRNSLTSLSPLDGTRLTKLKRLNLAWNQFTTLDSMPKLNSLEYLRLEGNQIAHEPNFFATLHSRCPNLRSLWLRHGNGTGSNPLCQTNPQYRLDALSNFPHLTMLDGERITRKDTSASGSSFYTLYGDVEKSTRQWSESGSEAADRAKKAKEQALVAESNIDALKIEQWITATPPHAIAPTDVVNELQPRMNHVRTSLNECTRILKEECDSLLAELEKKYKDASGNNGEKEFNTRTPSMSGDGNFGNFGETDE